MKYDDLYVWLVFDYSQIEIRFLAEMSGCAKLIKVFQSGKDIHAAVGHAVTGKPEAYFQDKLNDKPRVMIKGVHFAMVYGKTPPGLAKQLQTEGVNVTEEEVQAYFDGYFETYTEVKDFIEESHEFADKHGYVTTFFGFKREIMKIGDDRGTFWKNQAVNSRIQGSAGQLLRIALAERQIKPKTFWALNDIRMEVHDALYYRVKVKDMIAAYQQGMELLENQVKKAVTRRFGIDLQVPLVADAKAGFRQGALVGYGGEGTEGFLKKWIIHNAKMDDRISESLREIAR